MKYSKFKIAQKITLVLFVVVAIYIGNVVFFPRAIPTQEYQLIINKDEPVYLVAVDLYKNSIISNKRVFLLILRALGADKNISAGMYSFKSNISMWGVLSRIKSGHPDQISFTIIEGLRFSQIKEEIDSLRNIKHLTTSLSESQLKAMLKIPYPNLEGVFYPSTYFVAPGQSDLEIYQSAYKLMQNKLTTLYAKKSGVVHYVGPYQMLILASLIQKETANKNDMINVATVFNNRLGVGMKLQDDPAVFYGLHNIEKIHRKDFLIDTKYNTYLHEGLTPTPICTPSEEALFAASQPLNKPELLYFIAVGNGQTKFAPSYDEHKAMIRKYLKK
jgi:UPF0755 protein